MSLGNWYDMTWYTTIHNANEASASPDTMKQGSLVVIDVNQS